MITALDHVVLLCPDIDAAVADYTVLMGAEPVWHAREGGTETAVYHVRNTYLELLGPHGAGDAADKLREMTAKGAKFSTLVYRSDDLSADHHQLKRRGLDPVDILPGQSRHLKSGEARDWNRFRIPDEHVAGVKSFVLERTMDFPEPESFEEGSVTKLDHLVINTPNPDRAAALYGARLGLRFALDRRAPEWKTRFLFFRLGGLTLEVINRLDQISEPDDPDTIWGVTWAVEDLEAAHQRLNAAQRDVSEIRTGRKPGSRVFTVRDGTLGIPTLFIHHAPR
ncbi:MAG: VOC family protein [Pseudomonadota bacterium]